VSVNRQSEALDFKQTSTLRAGEAMRTVDARAATSVNPTKNARPSSSAMTITARASWTEDGDASESRDVWRRRRRRTNIRGCDDDTAIARPLNMSLQTLN